MSNTLIKKIPLNNFWARNKNSIWMGSTFKLHRNLKTHFFPHKLSPQFLADLTVMLKSALLKNNGFKKSSFFLMNDLKPNDFQFLYEYYIPRKDYNAFRGSEGIIVDSYSQLHVLINTEDHLIVNLIDEKNHLEKALHKLLSIDNELSKEIEFAFSQKLGFLTSDFYKCGTGLEVSLILHLPALTLSNTLEDTVEQIHSSATYHTSFLGDDDEFLGDLVCLTNRQMINLSEEQIIKTLHTHALTLIIAEKKMRDTITNDPNHPIKNEISKAFGTLKHAYQLEVKEALTLVSLCKLGVELGIIKQASLEEVNELFFSLRKGILKTKKTNPDENLAELRSSQIKNCLKKAKL